jgi:hypothetical protein
MHGGPSLAQGDIVWARRADFDKNNNQFVQFEVFGHIVGRDDEGQNYIEIIQGKEFLDLFGKGLQFARIGNLTDPQRRGYILISSSGPGTPRIDIADGVDSISKFGTVDTLLVRLGKLDVVDANFGDLTGVTGALFKQNVYIKGKLAGGSASALMTGAGYWFEPGGNARIGNPSTNKYLKFDVNTGVFEFGSAVTLQWAQITGAGKPQDYATVGADWETNVSNRPPNLVALGDLPGYIQLTKITSTTIESPTIAGNTILGGAIIASLGGSNTAGMTGEGSGDNAVRIWAGALYSNRANAPFRVTQGGVVYANKLTIANLLGGGESISSDFAQIYGDLILGYEGATLGRGRLIFYNKNGPPAPYGRVFFEVTDSAGEGERYITVPFKNGTIITTGNLDDITAVSLGTLSAGANDSGGPGYRILRVPNA